LTANGRTYTPNSLNQYTSLTSPSQSLSYDVNGNLTNWAGTTYTHDSQGQLVYVGNYVALSYDYRRLRVGESVLLDEYEDIWENISTMYDARGNLVERYDDNTYVDRQFAYADGIDEVVLLRSGDYYGQDIKAVVSDHLGSVVAYCSATGTKLVDGDYAPFGGPAVGANNGVLGMLGFTGREYDINTGLYYYRNRWYSPDLGRFLEPDPIGLAGWDLNLYRYVGNQPMDWVDPFGLWRWPDFYQININIAIPNPWTGTLVGVSGVVSISRYGHLYYSPFTGATVGKSATVVSGSLTAGWLNRFGTPTANQLNGFLCSNSFNAMGGFWGGAGLSYTPGSGTATQVGFVSPQFGGSWNYSFAANPPPPSP
jgi:RHS repeat-associated protein